MKTQKNIKEIIIIIFLSIVLLLSLVIKCFEIPIIMNYEKFNKYISKGYRDSYEFKDKNNKEKIYLKKYYYNNNDYKDFSMNYAMVTDENIENVKLCFNDFYEKLKLYNKEKELNVNNIDSGDYVYIKRLNLNKSKKKYEIYFYDIKTDELYYICLK